MKLKCYLIIMLFIPLLLSAQYTESFNIANKGILGIGGTAAACSTNELSSCNSIDFTGVSWTIGGILAGIDGEGLSTSSGNLVFSDVDQLVCWISPTLDISSSGMVSGEIQIEFVGGWDVADYGYVEYSTDGGAYTKISDVTCGTSTINTFGDGCSIANGSYTATFSGVSGSTLDIRICLDANTSGETANLKSVSVPKAGVTVLPVELISFRAKKSEDIVTLNWSTATETDNERFEIEYSTSGEDFKKIGEVRGKGTSVEVTQYFFNHENPTLGQNYYRLKQVDFDQRFEYSNVVSILVETDKKNIGDFYPNPSEGGIVFLDYNSNRNSDLNIFIYNVAGKNIFENKIKIEKGANNLSFDFSTLEKGIYFVRLEDLGNQEYRKLIIN